MKISYTFFLIFLVVICRGQHPQGMQTEFGKNRIQYQDFDWYFYRTEKFDTYFYLGGKELAIYTSDYAQSSLKKIEELLDSRLNGRIIFIIYNKLSDLRQTNIGIPEDQYNIGGVTNIVGNKAFLYFNGDHDNFKRQIKQGIAKILVNEMLFGGDIKEMMQNATLLSLPDWYIDGLSSFIGEDWNIDIDNEMRDGIRSGNFIKFNYFKEMDPVLAGHSVWNYVARNYGYTAISNIIYMTRINRNIESGFLFVLGSSLKKLGDDWLYFYRNLYNEEDSTRTLPENRIVIKNPKKDFIYSQIKSSPDGKKYAFCTNKFNKCIVWLHNTETGKNKKVLKFGHKSPDQIINTQMPIITWHPSGRILAIVYEKNAAYMLSLYELDEDKFTDIPMNQFEQILDIDYAYDAKTIAMSAVQKGHSDLFLYNINYRTFTKLTNDIYDDHHPRFINKSWQLVFDSNRPDDSLKTVNETDSVLFQINHDLFIYNQEIPLKPLSQLTFTSNISEIKPIEFDSGYVSFLSDVNGIYNLFIGQLDTVHKDSITVMYTLSSYPVSNYSSSLLNYHRNTEKNLTTFEFINNNRYNFFSEAQKTSAYLENTKHINLSATAFILDKYKSNKIKSQVNDTSSIQRFKNNTLNKHELVQEKTDSIVIDIDNYVFELDLVTEEETTTPRSSILKSKYAKNLTEDSLSDSYTRSRIFVLKTRPYQRAFTTNYVTTQLDNSNLNSSYQRFTGLGPVYFENPGLNAFVKVGINDLFEDFKIYGGFRMPGDLNNIEYFVSFEDLRKRLDKQYFYYKSSFLKFSSEFFNVYRIKTNDFRYILKWPFGERSSLRINNFIRYDKTVNLSTGVGTLPYPNAYDAWIGSRLEYVFDNTVQKDLNIRFGSRFKIYLEGFQNFLENTQGFTGSTGVDFRHYQKLHRNIIWANRVAFATSFGVGKIVYFLGGTNNWVSPKFDKDIEIANQQDYIYQTLVTNMRGFKQNIRNGNKVASVNSEIRLPAISYFYSGPLKSDFLRNFQIIAFVDAGTAWVGKSPFSEGNAFNTEIIKRHPLIINVSTIRNPIVWGYGGGVRSRLLGYFVKADLAWGYEDNQIRNPILYISLSKDF